MRICLFLMSLTLSGCAIADDDVAKCHIEKDLVGKPSDSDEIQVQLNARKMTYLIGEPVIFTVDVKNNTRKLIDVWVDSLRSQVQVFISQGDGFERYDDRMQDIGKVVPSTEELGPGKTKGYELKMLYSKWTKDQKEPELAFPITGTYCVKVKYPLFPDRKMIESHVIHLTFKNPTGNDATIWKQINRPEVLRFLQSDRLKQDEEDIPVELAGLVDKFPKSGYADALKASLRFYYQKQAGKMYNEDLRTDPWMKRLRKMLDIEFKDTRLFPDDKRLNAKIRLDYPEFTPIQEVYDDLSEQSGVLLRIHPDLRVRRIKGIPRTEELRKFMESAAAYKAKWIKDVDGYKLVPDPPMEKKPSEPK